MAIRFLIQTAWYDYIVEWTGITIIIPLLFAFVARNTINRVACTIHATRREEFRARRAKKKQRCLHAPDANKLDTRRSVKVNYDGGASATCFPRALSKTERTTGRLGERSTDLLERWTGKYFLTWNTLRSTREIFSWRNFSHDPFILFYF